MGRANSLHPLKEATLAILDILKNPKKSSPWFSTSELVELAEGGIMTSWKRERVRSRLQVLKRHGLVEYKEKGCLWRAKEVV